MSQVTITITYSKATFRIPCIWFRIQGWRNGKFIGESSSRSKYFLRLLGDTERRRVKASRRNRKI